MNEGDGKRIVIIAPKYLRFEPNKTYIVEVDLQRFPDIRKFKNKKGEEYWACTYNIRVIKEDGKDVNSEWMQRRISVGDISENSNNIVVRPRINSEFWQLYTIKEKYGDGFHICTVTTKEGNKGQVIATFNPVKDHKEIESNYTAIAEEIKKVGKGQPVNTEKIAKHFNIDETTAKKALEILVDQGDALKVRENLFYVNP